MFRFPFLDVGRQFAAAMGFQLLHHIGAELGNQAEDMLGGEVLKAQPIHGIADRHIAGKTQQPFIHILRAQFRTHGAGRKDRKSILPLSDHKVPIPHLFFDVLPQCVIHLLPACQPPQGVAEGGRLLIGEALQRLFGQVPLQQLAGKEGGPALVPNDHREAGMVFFGGSIQHILNAPIGVCQHFGGCIRFMDQVITAMYAVAFGQTHSRRPLFSRLSVIGIKICW